MWIVWFLVITWFAPFILAPIFRCTPVDYAWNGWKGDSKGTCLDYSSFTWAHNGINIVYDLVIILLPIPQVWKLQMDFKKKISLIVMFSLGLL